MMRNESTMSPAMASWWRLNWYHASLHEALPPRGSHVVERKVLEHLGSHISRDRRDVEEREDGDRHDRVLDLLAERREVVDLQRRAVDEREPAELDAEDDDEQETGEEGRHRETHEREGRRGVVEERVPLDRRDHPDGDPHEDAEDVGHAHHGERVRKALRDEVAY